MPQSPFYVIKQLATQELERRKKLIEFVYSQSDAFATWIIGFAIGAVSLIISNIDKLEKNFSGLTKPIVLLLTLTICFGLLFRYCNNIVIVLHKKLEDYFAGVFGDFDMTPIEPDINIDNLSFDEILFNLKIDFDVEIPYKPTSSIPEDLKEQERLQLIKYYKQLCRHSRKQFDLIIDHLAEVNEHAYKIKKNRFIEAVEKGLKKPKVGFRLKLWSWIISIFYLLFILSFMGATILTCVGFFCYSTIN